MRTVEVAEVNYATDTGIAASMVSVACDKVIVNQKEHTRVLVEMRKDIATLLQMVAAQSSAISALDSKLTAVQLQQTSSESASQNLPATTSAETVVASVALDANNLTAAAAIEQASPPPPVSAKGKL